MQILPYLNFDGRCREAFDFYRAALGGERLDVMTYGESPMAAGMPESSHALVMHACLQVGGTMLMGADGPPPHAPSDAKDFVNLMVDTPADAERVWARLAEGADVRMPLQATFWAERFGMLVDRYGKAWMVNCLARDPATCGDAA
jgi:PhnB protein